MQDVRRSAIRILVPLLILIVGGGIAWVSLANRTAQSPASPTTATQTPLAADASTPKPIAAQADAPSTPAAQSPAAPQPLSAQPTIGAPATSTQATPPASAAAATKFQARTFPIQALAPLGSLTTRHDGGTHELAFLFSPVGAGVESLKLANHFTTTQKLEHDSLQTFAPLPGDTRLGLTPFAIDAIDIDGQRVSLWLTTDVSRSFWKQTAPGAFEAIIEDAEAREVLRIRRTYELQPGSYAFTIRQSIDNLSSTPHDVKLVQFGPIELPPERVKRAGDVRRVRFGYFLPTTLDPDQVVMSGDIKGALLSHADALGKPVRQSPTGLAVWDNKTLWPTEETTKQSFSPAWTAITSRYFTVGVHMPETPAKAPQDRVLTKVAQTIDRVAIAGQPDPHTGEMTGVFALRLTSSPFNVAPGASVDVSLGAYAGPLSESYILKEPAAAWTGLEKLVIFTFSGPCGFCTFQPIAYFLRWFLGLLHNHVFHDWALAIMFLVVCVRSLLHPVTRWSQTNMLRFGKQMGKLAPKQKAIQEKFGNDPAKMREEIARLMKEEHISYGAGAMGCLPMFLQTPVWIALYAMLFFTFELRHEPAFYSLFQSFSGGKWQFLADLAEPDHFIPFGKSFWIPFVSGLMGPIEALNILPLVLGVVFYIQQKYLQPPTTTTMTPEQLQQQKIMKVMTVVMFPLIMYNAPSGLALYFLTNSTLGILESKWIRAHAEKLIEKEDAARQAKIAAGVSTSMWDRKKKPGQDQPQGFLAKMAKAVEEAQKLRDQKKKLEDKKGRR